MDATGTVRLPFPDPGSAKRAADSLEPDNDGHLQTHVEDAVLVLQAKGGSVMSLLRTFDDALACLRAAGMD